MSKIIKGLGIALVVTGVIGALTLIEKEKSAVPKINAAAQSSVGASQVQKSENVDVTKQTQPTQDQKNQVAEVSSNWQYDESVDKMRGETKYAAATQSTNTYDLGFPYNQTKLGVMVRNWHKKNEIVLGTNAQFQCNMTESCFINAKFDDGQIEKFAVNQPDDMSSQALFVDKSSEFLNKLKASKHLIIESQMFQSGTKQFEFNLEGLKWEH